MKWIIITIVLGLPTIVGAGGWWYWSSIDVLEDTLEDLGFVPIKVPSKNYAIGSIVHVNSSGRIKRTVCEAPMSLIAPYLKDSPGEYMARNELRNSQFAFLGRAINKINAQLNGNAVREVALEFVDVRVREISDDASLLLIQDELLKSAHCANAVRKLLEANEYVCQSTALLEASVSYVVGYDRETTTSGRVTESDIVEVVRNVTNDEKISGLGEKIESAESAAEGSGRGNDNLKQLDVSAGDNLNYGMKIYPFCLTLKDGNPKPLPQSDIERLVFWLRDELGAFWA